MLLAVPIELWSTWEVWRALKKLEFSPLSPRATLIKVGTHDATSPCD